MTKNFNDDEVQQYLNENDGLQMHKVVLQAKNENDLMKISANLKQEDAKHVVWVRRYQYSYMYSV